MKRIMTYLDKKLFIMLMITVVFGNVLHDIILLIDKDEDVTVFPLGTVMVIMVAFCYMLYYTAFEDTLKFNTYVSMGCTRREYFTGRVIGKIVQLIISVVMAFGCYMFERWKFVRFYPGIEAELDMAHFFDLQIIVPIMLFMVAVSFTVSICVMKFGNKAMVGLWVIFMFIGIGFPRIMEAADISALNVAELFEQYKGLIVLSVAAISVIVVVIDRMMIMKQAVR